MRSTHDSRTLLKRLVEFMGAQVEYNGPQVTIKDCGTGSGTGDDLGPIETNTWGAIGHLLTVATIATTAGGLGLTYETIHNATRFEFSRDRAGVWVFPATVIGSVDAQVSRLAGASESAPDAWKDQEEEGSVTEPTTPSTEKVNNPQTGKEAPVAGNKTVVQISGRVDRVVKLNDIKGLEFEKKARGRGTTLILTGSATALKKVSTLCATAFDARKGTEAQEYEDRYQAGQAVTKIAEALSEEKAA